MHRRAALQRMALMAGGLAIAPDLLAGIAARVASGEMPAQVTAERLALLGAMADTILPDTDVPGASAAGAHRFVVLAVEDCLKPVQRTAFWEGLTDFEQYCQQSHSHDFVSATPEKKAIALRTFIEAGKAKNELGEKRTRFWRTLKELTMQGYFTSEIGMTQALAYDPLPGSWIADMKIDENTKAWASYF